MAPNLKGKMLTFWKLNGSTEGNGTVTAPAAIDTTTNNYHNDMEAALLKMRNFLRNGTLAARTEMCRVWTTNNTIQSSGHQQLLLSKLKLVQVLLLETNKFFKLNPSQPDEKNYNAGSICIVENYDRIKKQVKIIQKYFGEKTKLPEINNVPRIYVIAREIVSTTDGNFDIECLINCLKRFQHKINLTLEELWTIPVMLKLALIEHVALASTTIVMNSIFSKNLEFGKPKNLAEFSKIVANFDLPKLQAEFLFKVNVEIERNLGNYDIALPWFGCYKNQTFSHSDQDISSSIRTLSVLSALEWETISFVERVSVIDQIFEKSTGINFQLLDRSTKDRYRLVVHRIVKNSLLSEEEVATLAVNLAENYKNMEIDSETSGDAHKSDIGYYLIDSGLPLLQKMSQMKLNAAQKFRQYCCPVISIFHYVGSILFISAVLGILFSNFFNSGLSNCNLYTLAFICTFLVSTQWANEIINRLATKLIAPNLLPRFDFDKTGIPKQFRTFVVVPCLISNFESINSLISKLEIRFLGNQDDNLDFALLTDFEDANREMLPDDQPLLDYLKSKIVRLNACYSKQRSNGRSIFYAFHRPRIFNPTDNIWMGYERKRGKLAAFNNFLRGIETENFNFIVGDTAMLERIKYVITLDTDTSLPRDVARKLVGTMAHPLNRPVVNKIHQSVDRGYGILQPRISLNLPVANSSPFSKIFSANYSELDPYSRTVSNLYQDLFGESSYIGKGIYDVDAFQKILTGTFPENRILSHDLLEGNYLRTGFVGDVQLYEDFPQTYISDLVRRHRWIRGDWQNVNYIGDGNFSTLSKWKIFDNLRRSVIPTAELLLFLIHWQTLPIVILLGLRIVFSSVVQDLMSFCKHFLKFNRKSKYFWDFPGKNELTASLMGIWNNILLFFFEISCLPNEAYYSVDAIVRTLFRLIISKKFLLEWTACGSSKNDSGLNFGKIVWKMSSGPIVFLAIIVSTKTEIALLPILFCWGLSPLFSWYLSQSPKIVPKRSVLSSEDISFLRRIARKTWAYFERFNIAEENYLPPDNYREFPNELIAHRTSPTNIGLAVLSNLTAYDFGYLSCTEMVQRMSNTFDTLAKLEKYRGHFYNWYDTRDGTVLLPKYVSTVDSGNLAASLLVLRQGLLTLPDAHFVSNKIFEGLLDAFRLSLKELDPVFSEETMELKSMLEEAIKKRNSLAETYQYLRNVQMICTKISDNVVDSNQSYVWFEKLQKQLVAAMEDLLRFAPWLKLGKFPDEFQRFENILNGLVSLRALAEYPLTIQPQYEKVSAEYTRSKIETKAWLENLNETLTFARKNALRTIVSLEELARTCENLANQMEYDFLYDTQRRLLRIGCDVEKNLSDDSCYDLLASEARLGIFVAIAQGKVPQETWFKLGRKITKKSKVLQSWTGSMFEYLMPQLLMPIFENTTLSRTLKEIVKIQAAYGRTHNMPWGISESSCSTWVSSSQDYFYRAAGIKELSLDPKLENSFVIAPYASMLALMICPKSACSNLKEMSRQECEGSYGFYEAVDFTPNSLDGATNRSKKIIGSFMAHHQAMSFLALENLLLNEPMQRRFEEDPNFQSCMILLK